MAEVTSVSVNFQQKMVSILADFDDDRSHHFLFSLAGNEFGETDPQLDAIASQLEGVLTRLVTDKVRSWVESPTDPLDEGE